MQVSAAVGILTFAEMTGGFVLLFAIAFDVFRLRITKLGMGLRAQWGMFGALLLRQSEDSESIPLQIAYWVTNVQDLLFICSMI